MKKIGLGQMITILANVGVIAGIAFLAVELRQNNEMMRAQTRNDIAQSVAGLIRDTTDTEFMEIELKARDNPAELTQIERSKLIRIYQVQFRTWENIHYQYRMGLFDEEEFAVERRVWESNFQQDLQRELPLWVLAWCFNRDVMSPTFRREMDVYLQGVECSELVGQMIQEGLLPQ